MLSNLRAPNGLIISIWAPEEENIKTYKNAVSATRGLPVKKIEKKDSLMISQSSLAPLRFVYFTVKLPTLHVEIYPLSRTEMFRDEVMY